MKNEDVELNINKPSNNKIGKALTELKAEYLSELQNKQISKMLKINTRYVSNVSIGYRIKNNKHHNRYEPYKNPKERYRTKSENYETEENYFITSLVDKLDTSQEEISQLKRAKSLESIISQGNQTVDFEHLNMGMKLEDVSNSIQNLKVVE